ncbi:MAG: cyclic nucleotide-binding domain-containing protein [Spirochaetes bacterium]|nr:cyclic nucleotide-binding domain-containing protein [Spirochaetota bacterium]
MDTEIKTIQFVQGSAIQVENTPNEGYFYILKTGTLSIQSDVIFYSKHFNRYQAGDTFGLVSGLTRNPSRYTLIADEDCEIIRIPINLLGKYLRDNKNICLKIISLHSNQLRMLNSYLVKKYTGQQDTDNPQKLFEDGKYYADSGKADVAAYCFSKYIKWAEQSPHLNQTTIEQAKNFIKKINPDYKERGHDSNNMHFKTGEVVFIENEPADYFYVIENGAVKISKLVGSEEFILCILREGEIFGEMSILNNKARNASAIVFQDSDILKLSVDTFMDSVGDKLLLKIFESISRRIWYAHQRISMLGMDDPNGMLYAYLQILISDINSKNKSWDSDQKEYIFAFSLYDLKKMVQTADISDESIRDFLSDKNIDISNHIIRVVDRKKIDIKVAHYKSRHRKKHIFDMPA